VRDEQVGEAERVAQISQKIEDGRLYRHIERRHRLVADDEARPCRKRAGNRDALPSRLIEAGEVTAGNLMQHRQRLASEQKLQMALHVRIHHAGMDQVAEML
jgi:hypothetical protein